MIQNQLRRTVAKTLLLFFAAYLLFSPLWMVLKGPYGYAITFVSSKLAAGLKGARLEELPRGKDILQATFSPLGRNSNMLIDVSVKTSSYTFNVPLTFGIAAALYPFINRRRRAYCEAALMLLTVHFLYVFTLEAKELTEVLMGRGIEKTSSLRLMIYQFAWGFTDNMAIRFEPFLVGVYIFIRYGKRPDRRQ